MIRIETERLVIRNFARDDWCELHEMILKYQASEAAQYDHQWPTGAEDIQGVAEWFASGDHFLAVCLKTAQKLIGFVSLNPEEKESGLVFNLGYVFNADYHGQGYALEACRGACKHAFTQLEAERLAASTALANQPSCTLLKRLGMREVGRGTSSFRKRPDGTPVEFVGLSFEITRDEWSWVSGISKLD